MFAVCICFMNKVHRIIGSICISADCVVWVRLSVVRDDVRRYIEGRILRKCIAAVTRCAISVISPCIVDKYPC